MKWFHRLCVGLVTLAIACASSESIEIADGGLDGGMEAELAIRAALASNEDCSVSDTVLVEGSWDFASGENYWALLALEWLTIPDPDARLPNVTITSFDVTLEALDGTALSLDDLPNPYSVSATSVIPASNGEEPALGTGLLLGIPASYAPAISDLGLDEIVIQVVANGTTSSGDRLFSEPFPLRLNLCDGCGATDCPPDAEPCLPGSNGEPWCRE